MKVFCFHSVRSSSQIPAASQWSFDEKRVQFEKHLCVEPSWMMDFIINRFRHFYEGSIITFDDGYRDVLTCACISASMGIKTIVFVPTAHFNFTTPGSPIDVMSEQDALYLMSNHVIIGSHSHRHINLGNLDSGGVSRELLSSYNILQGMYCSMNGGEDGEFNIPFAPPHGEFTSEVVSLAKEVGFSDIYGTTEMYGCEGIIRRYLADSNGYFDYETGEEVSWPWL